MSETARNLQERGLWGQGRRAGIKVPSLFPPGLVVFGYDGVNKVVTLPSSQPPSYLSVRHLPHDAFQETNGALHFGIVNTMVETLDHRLRCSNSGVGQPLCKGQNRRPFSVLQMPFKRYSSALGLCRNLIRSDPKDSDLV